MSTLLLSLFGFTATVVFIADTVIWRLRNECSRTDYNSGFVTDVHRLSERATSVYEDHGSGE